MRVNQHIAVIGAGQAAARSIAALRDAGYAGAISLLGEEAELPYERPPLSKEALFGDAAPRAPTIFDEAFYRDAGVDLLLGRAVDAIDAGSGALRLADGSRLKADRILLATGARAREVTMAGVDRDRVFTLRNVADARRLRQRLTTRCRVVLIGGGFIGLEIAAGAASLGCDVTVIEARPRLIERAVSPMVSAMLSGLHRQHGVAIKTGCTVTSARQGVDETELLLDDGSRCIADLIIAGIGALPNDELARQAGIRCSNGIEVDAHCRTSSPNVWAAGDVAARVHPFLASRVRIESWENADLQAARAARSIAHSWTPDDPSRDAASDDAEPPPWFWTDQYDLNLQILGCVSDSNRVLTRHDGNGKPSVIFHLRDDTLRGAELISAGRERTLVKKLLQAGRALPLEQLADAATPLKTILGRGPGQCTRD
jgi:NADPH-dependent 2,4-dienoyl-CoA reductase/sulfur reductase-like enzyme